MKTKSKNILITIALLLLITTSVAIIFKVRLSTTKTSSIPENHQSIFKQLQLDKLKEHMESPATITVQSSEGSGITPTAVSTQIRVEVVTFHDAVVEEYIRSILEKDSEPITLRFRYSVRIYEI